MAGVRAGNDALSMGAQLSALGTVLLPGEPLASGIRRAVAQKGTTGGRLLVPPGVWDVGANGLTINTAGLEIVALSPGATVFRRVRGDAAGTVATFGSVELKYAVLTITAANVTIRGVTLLDSASASPSATYVTPGVLVMASGATVDGCMFQDCDRAVAVYGNSAISKIRITNNTLTAVRATECVDVGGTCSSVLVSGNRGAGSILLLSGTTYSSVVGNVLDTGARITFVGGNAGNFAAGNNAPVNEEGAYALEDNHPVTAVDVPGFPTWDVTVYRSLHMRYQISRGATPDIEAGELTVIMNSAECDAYVDGVATATSPGVTLSGVVAGGTAKLQYKTTSTGDAATLTILSVTYGGA